MGATEITYGFDIYQRNWDGEQVNKDSGVVTKPDFFPDADALDLGLYLKAARDISKWSVGCGIRGDSFETKANDLVDGKLRFSRTITGTNKSKDIFLSGYLFSEYYITEQSNFFGGVGRSARAPTLVERYLQAAAGFYGNPDLKETKNTEVDFGFRAELEKFSFRTKGFYSNLDDYIYQEGPGPKTWTNIDAYLYGCDATAIMDVGSDFSIEAAAAYQRGRKKSQPRSNDDGNLAEIPPLKAKLALRYDTAKYFGVLEWIHSEDANNVDIDAGEQGLPGWNAVNFRAGCQYKQLTLNLGIDNVFDEQYAVANSYEWDVVAGSGANPAIVNEPGRFVYASASYSF